MKRLIISQLVILLGVSIGLYIGSKPQPNPKPITFSGPVSNGHNPYGTHGIYEHTIAFSPDTQNLAYIWSDDSYYYPPGMGSRPCTLTESLEIRVRSISEKNDKLRIPLDSIDLRPSGKIYFELDAGLQFSPDSKHLAALCSRRLILLDVIAKTNRSIEYPSESFGTFSWLDTNTLCFSTFDSKSMTFWRWTLNNSPADRVKIYSDASTIVPDELQQVQWSPNGRFVCLRIPAGTNGRADAILDAQTGSIKKIPFYLIYLCWKPDDSALLVYDSFGKDHPTYLVNPATGDIENLSTDFDNEFGHYKDITLVAPVWTPDGKYVVLYANSVQSTAIQQGYLIQPKPFKVLLSTNQIIRWSPIPGWLLLQGQMSFKWIRYDGTATAPIQGWPNDWTWSTNGRYAAKIGEGRLEIIKPSLPPGQ